MENIESGSGTERNEERVIQEQKGKQNTDPSVVLGAVPEDCSGSVHICPDIYDNWTASEGQGDA